MTQRSEQFPFSRATLWPNPTAQRHKAFVTACRAASSMADYMPLRLVALFVVVSRAWAIRWRSGPARSALAESTRAAAPVPAPNVGLGTRGAVCEQARRMTDGWPMSDRTGQCADTHRHSPGA